VEKNVGSRHPNVVPAEPAFVVWSLPDPLQILH